MKRIAGLTIAWGLVLLALAPMAAASYQVASASPASGPPGTAATVIISGFVGGVPVEVHAGSKAGALLGSGSVNASGIGGVPITIPSSAPPGPYVLYVCGSCASEFPANEVTTTFDVIAPPTTTTTTTTAPPPPVTTSPPPGTTPTTEPAPPPGIPCLIPDGAIVVDFDDLNRDMGFLADRDSELNSLLRVLLRNNQFHHSGHVRSVGDGITRKTFYGPERASVAYVADNPANGLGTSSPPNVLRSIDTGLFSVDPWQPGLSQRSESLGLSTTVDVWQMNGQLDYLGFNVGFGHFGEGFDTPDELVVELVVAREPIQDDDGPITPGGYWETVSVTLGPGPQPVTTCLMAVSTIDAADPSAAYHFDIRPTDGEGRPVHIPVDIDDFFYGVYAPPIPMDGGALPVPSTIAEPPPEPMPDVTIPEPGVPAPESDWPLRVAFGLAGLILGAGSLWAFKK